MKIEQIGTRYVWRDDLRAGGTKAAILPQFIRRGEAVAYAGPCEGYAQLALAIAAKQRGAQAHLFCAARALPHPITTQAREAGAIVHEQRPGYLTVVRKRARDFCVAKGVRLFPFGLDFPEFEAALADYAHNAAASIDPPEVWCAAGSGLLARALGRAFPRAEIVAVAVGRKPNAGRAKVLEVRLPFAREAKVLPPFPSCKNYDAKVWAFFDRGALPGALFWNVAS